MPSKLEKQKQWQVFEEEVKLLVEAFGYKAEATQPSHDYGVDVVAISDRRKLVVQCKLYGKSKIGGDVIMQLLGSQNYFGATNSICITTSQFTKQAQEVATNGKVLLVDREKLVLLCKEKDLTIPSLTVIEGTMGSWRLDKEMSLRIGRIPDNHIRLDHDTVSKHHAILKRSGLVLLLEDCGSTNGTFVNGKKIAFPVPLNYGDSVRFAKVKLQIGLKLQSESSIW